MRRRRRGSRRRRSNPGMSAIGSPVAAIKSGFNVSTLKRAATITSGAIGNGYLSNFIKNYIPGGYGQNQYVGYAVGLGSAGLLGMIARKVKPDLAADVMMGGVLGVVAMAVKDFMPTVQMLGRYLGDSLTSGQLRSVRPLQGMDDYLTAGAVGRARSMGDYLTSEDFSGILPLQAPSADQMIANEFGGN